MPVSPLPLLRECCRAFINSTLGGESSVFPTVVSTVPATQELPCVAPLSGGRPLTAEYPRWERWDRPGGTLRPTVNLPLTVFGCYLITVGCPTDPYLSRELTVSRWPSKPGHSRNDYRVIPSGRPLELGLLTPHHPHRPNGSDVGRRTEPPNDSARTTLTPYAPMVINLWWDVNTGV